MKLRMQSFHQNGMDMAYRAPATWLPQPESSLPEYTRRFAMMVEEHGREMYKTLVCLKDADYSMQPSYGVG